MKKCVFLVHGLAFLLMLFVSNAMGQAKRFEGQVVCCEECWAQADRTKVEFGTAADLLKSQSCVANGDPTLIAVREGDGFNLYQLEQAKFRLPGKNWLEFVGKHVAVTGTVQKRGSANVIRVDSLEVLVPSLAEQEAQNVIGKEIELTLKDPFGTPQSLSALKGRIVIVNFWATYCIPCRKEMPDLAAIQNEFAALGVQVVGASTDEPGDRDKVLQFIKETKINFPIWIGAATADMIRFGLGAALRGTVIIGRDGNVLRVISGVVNLTELKKQIESMLASAEKTSVEERKQIARAKQTDASSVPS